MGSLDSNYTARREEEGSKQNPEPKKSSASLSPPPRSPPLYICARSEEERRTPLLCLLLWCCEAVEAGFGVSCRRLPSEREMQQHLMQMQPMMAAYASPNQVTTDIIQQYLDENKQLILAILDNQNAGKADECAENQAKLQRNLMYLAAIADNQQQAPTIAQFPPNPVMQSSPRYMQHPQAQPMTPQSLMAARSSMLYAQSPISALQQQQQAALHSQLGVSSGGSSGGFNMLHGEANFGGNALAGGVFSDFSRNSSMKQEAGSALSNEGRGSNNSGRQNGDGTKTGYMKGGDEEGN